MRRYIRRMSWERVVVGHDVRVDTAGWLADDPGNLHERPALAPCTLITSGRLALPAPVAGFVASSSTPLQHKASSILDSLFILSKHHVLLIASAPIIANP
jgi:hypothetical protein